MSFSISWRDALRSRHHPNSEVLPQLGPRTEKRDSSPACWGSSLKQHLEGMFMKYEGRLSKPLIRKRMGPDASDGEYADEINRLAEEMISKMPDLFKAHGLKDGQYLQLALELAKAHVPGFQVRISAGRKTQWTRFDKAELRADVDDIIQKTGLTVVKAIRQAILLDAWRKKAEPMTIAALEKHYYTADELTATLIRAARTSESIGRSN